MISLWTIEFQWIILGVLTFQMVENVLKLEYKSAFKLHDKDEKNHPTDIYFSVQFQMNTTVDHMLDDFIIHLLKGREVFDRFKGDAFVELMNQALGEGSNTFLTRSPESSKDANMKNLKKASKYLQGKIELEQNTVQIYTSAIDNLHKLDISDEDSLAKMNEIMDEVDQAVANVDDKIREYEERGKTLKDQNDK